MPERSLYLVEPSLKFLESYCEAYDEGFRNMQLGFGNDTPDIIRQDPQAYFNKIAGNEPILVTLKNGQTYAVTDHEILWLTDGKRFIGSIVLRYRGDNEIIEGYCGNRGLAIRPSLKGKGYGNQSWLDTWPEVKKRARKHGLTFLLATTDMDNHSSYKLIEKHGGILLESNSDKFGEGPIRIYKLSLD